MMYDDLVEECLEIAFGVRRNFLLSKCAANSQAIARAVRVDLVNLLEGAEGIGWLSIAGQADRHLGRGGAWVCINCLKVYSEVNDDEELNSVAVTIFSHKLGAGFGNIIIQGVLKFSTGEKMIARLQADGSYLVTRDGTKMKVIGQADVQNGLSNDTASEYADRFGML